MCWCCHLAADLQTTAEVVINQLFQFWEIESTQLKIKGKFQYGVQWGRCSSLWDAGGFPISTLGGGPVLSEGFFPQVFTTFPNPPTTLCKRLLRPGLLLLLLSLYEGKVTGDCHWWDGRWNYELWMIIWQRWESLNSNRVCNDDASINKR